MEDATGELDGCPGTLQDIQYTWKIKGMSFLLYSREAMHYSVRLRVGFAQPSKEYEYRIWTISWDNSTRSGLQKTISRISLPFVFLIYSWKMNISTELKLLWYDLES